MNARSFDGSRPRVTIRDGCAGVRFASGETLIVRVYHIDRGHEGIVEEPREVGADFERARALGV